MTQRRHRGRVCTEPGTPGGAAAGGWRASESTVSCVQPFLPSPKSSYAVVREYEGAAPAQRGERASTPESCSPPVRMPCSLVGAGSPAQSLFRTAPPIGSAAQVPPTSA